MLYQLKRSGQLDRLAGVHADTVDVRISKIVRPDEHPSRRVA